MFLLSGCGRGIDCPDDMVGVPAESGSFCIHRYEVHLEGQLGNRDQGVGYPDGSTRVTLRAEKGLSPTLVSWYQAAAACDGVGLHLCTSREWEDACDGQSGAGGAIYPTRNGKASAGVCAIGDLSSLDRISMATSGAYPACRTPTGVYDLMGNLWEWADPGAKTDEGTPIIDKRGGGHYGAEPVPCSYGSVGSHAPSFDGTIGFRCCKLAGDR